MKALKLYPRPVSESHAHIQVDLTKDLAAAICIGTKIRKVLLDFLECQRLATTNVLWVECVHKQNI